MNENYDQNENKRENFSASDAEENGNVELLNELYRNAELGKLSLANVIKQCADEKFKSLLLTHFNAFDEISGKIASSLVELRQTPKSNNVFKNMMMKTSIRMTTAVDNSVAKLADMLVQGNNMGIIDVNKLLNNRSKDVAPPTIELAHELIDLEQSQIEELKPFL